MTLTQQSCGRASHPTDTVNRPQDCKTNDGSAFSFTSASTVDPSKSSVDPSKSSVDHPFTLDSRDVTSNTSVRVPTSTSRLRTYYDITYEDVIRVLSPRWQTPWQVLTTLIPSINEDDTTAYGEYRTYRSIRINGSSKVRKHLQSAVKFGVAETSGLITTRKGNKSFFRIKKIRR